METENKDWKPEVGKHVWVVENYTILQKKVLRVDPSDCALLRGRRGDDLYEGFKCYPTPEAALASIKIYDLEGKEVVIPRASVENSEAPTKLSKEREMELLNLAIAYGDADYQQKDGADRAWHHVAEAREKLIAFVENREPELDDEY